MLQTINERIQGWVAWTIIILIAVTFVLFGANYYHNASKASNVKAKINGAVVTKAQFDAAYRRLKRELGSSSINESKLKSDTLEHLVMQKILREAAKSNGFTVSVDQAKNEIINFEQFKENGNFSEQLFQATLSRALYTPELFMEQIQNGILNNQLRFGFLGTDFVLPNELNRYVSFNEQLRSYRYVVLKKENGVESNSVSKKEIENYYRLNKNEFMSKEQVSLSYVYLSMKALVQSINISSKEISNFYNENKPAYTKPASYQVAHIFLPFPSNADAKVKNKLRIKADSIFSQARKTKDFNALVMKYSGDHLAKNGKLPKVNLGVMEPAFDQVAMSLSQGEVSKPFETKFGYEIVKLLDKTTAQIQPLEQVSHKIKLLLKNEKAQKLFNDKLDRLTELSYQNPDSLTSLAKNLDLKIRTSPFISRLGADSGLGANKRILHAAFSSEVLNDGENSQPVQFDADAVVVLRIKEHQKSSLKPLKLVAKEIKFKLQQAKSKALLKKQAASLLAALRNSNLKKAKGKNLDWNKVSLGKREDKNVNYEVSHLAFRLSNNTKNDSISLVALPNGNIAIVELLSISLGKTASLDISQRNALTEQLAANYGAITFDLYIKLLRKNAIVDIY